MIERWAWPTAVLAACASAHDAGAAARDVQIVGIDFETQVVELRNFGTQSESLSGWRFCTHDENEIRRYTSASGLNGVTIASQASLFVHFLDDAPAEAGRINRPGGLTAAPLDRGPYGLGLYVNSVFGVGSNIADHVQWSVDGVDDTVADERSDEAQSGGVWTDQSAWAATADDSVALVLRAESEGAVLHGPDDYEALPEPAAAVLQGSALAGLTAWLRGRRGRGRPARR